MSNATQVVRITHRRCGEYDCATIVLAPEDWDKNRIENEVYAAQEAYLVEFDKARSDEYGPPNPGYHVPYDKHPDRTIAEVKAEHYAAKAIYDAWQADQRKTTRPFERFLTERGFLSIWGIGATVRIECDWDHRHGQRMTYGDDKLDTMPTPAKLAGKPDDDDVYEFG